MSDADNIRLDTLPGGACAVVRALDGGSPFASRLAAMGLVPGSRLEVLQNTGRGPVLIRVTDTRIALGRGEAAKIRVGCCP